MNAPGAPAALFLHTGWRSCGTWLWSGLREDPRAMGFYEPLHEYLGVLTARDIGRYHPGTWQSGHEAIGPYFAEYAALIAPGGGVRGFRPELAYDGFFGQDAVQAAPLAAYLGTLLAAARAEGRVPVLKFCRSLGRVEPLVRAFPEALHVVLLRGPQAQFLSARRQFTEFRNRYFLLLPFFVLARNRDAPLVGACCGALGVALPAPRGAGLERALYWCWQHVRRLSWEERYRGLLAFWTACAIASLRAGAVVVDVETLAVSPAEQRRLARRIESGTGLAAGFIAARPLRAAAASGPPDAAMQAAHAAALAVLEAERDRLPPGAQDAIRAKLETGFVLSASLREAGAALARLEPVAASGRVAEFGGRIAEAANWWLARPLRRIGASALLGGVRDGASAGE